MDNIAFPTVTIAEAKKIISATAHRQSILLLSAPGVGKSDAVRQAAQAAGLECKSLLGTQIAPEDVSGIPRIVGERSVFCPPRILLPEKPEKFCLFLDELPAFLPDLSGRDPEVNNRFSIGNRCGTLGVLLGTVEYHSQEEVFPDEKNMENGQEIRNNV